MDSRRIHNRHMLVHELHEASRSHVLEKRRTTVYKTIYRTLEPTFTGDVGGFTTITPENNNNDNNGGNQPGASAPTPSSHSAAPPEESAHNPSSSDQFISNEPSESASLPPKITSPVVSDGGAISPTLVTNTTPGHSSVVASGSSTPDAASNGQAASGPSGAAIAGIAFGILAALLAIAVVAWLVLKRKKNTRGHQQLDDEKSTANAQPPLFRSGSSPGAEAPHVSLRPTTEFFPNVDQNGNPAPVGTGLLLGVGGGAAAGASGNSTRPKTNDSAHPDNPFSDRASVMGDQGAGAMPRPSTAQSSNSQWPEQVHSRISNNSLALPAITPTTPNFRGLPNSDTPQSGTEPSPLRGGGAVGGGGLTRKESMKKNAKPMDLTVALPGPIAAPPMEPIVASPTGTEFSRVSGIPDYVSTSSNGAAAIAAAGGPKNSTVHRVELAFTPNLEDEMELRAGQLVRLLHEYDDGWALCIRLDRSQQGVVPRTCLSARPVKPRSPAHGRPGPQVRPGAGPIRPGQGPGGPQSRPGSAASMNPAPTSSNGNSNINNNKDNNGSGRQTSEDAPASTTATAGDPALPPSRPTSNALSAAAAVAGKRVSSVSSITPAILSPAPAPAPVPVSAPALAPVAAAVTPSEPATSSNLPTTTTTNSTSDNTTSNPSNRQRTATVTTTDAPSTNAATTPATTPSRPAAHPYHPQAKTAVSRPGSIERPHTAGGVRPPSTPVGTGAGGGGMVTSGGTRSRSASNASALTAPLQFPAAPSVPVPAVPGAPPGQAL